MVNESTSVTNDIVASRISADGVLLDPGPHSLVPATYYTRGGFHLAYLGKPFRFWRMLLKPQTSWMARGFIFMLLFIVFGAVQLAYALWLPGSSGGAA